MARLDALNGDGMKVQLESAKTANGRDIAQIRSGDTVTARTDARLRFQVDYPRAKAVIALGQDHSGRWVSLFVPDQEEGRETFSLPDLSAVLLDVGIAAAKQGESRRP